MDLGELSPLSADALVALQRSVDRARSFLLRQAQTRTPYRSASVVPDDPTADRQSSGTWTGRYTLPTAPDRPAYTPILIKGPLHFPIVAGRPATFHGTVDLPFVSLEGMAADWGSFFVVGSVGGAIQFIAKVQANGAFKASVVSPRAGRWSFQLVTYPNAWDARADRNRIPIGHPWLESERPGDVRDYYAAGYRPTAPLFADVALGTSGSDSVITGILGAFAANPACRYKILVTNEVDVEYVWAFEAARAGPFTISKPRAFGGKVKLRLIELEKGRPRRVIGQVWSEENAAVGVSAWPDLRIEYRSIGERIPVSPDAVAPARTDGTWAVALKPPGVGRVSLVDVNTKRIYGECTMPSGLLRSYNVGAADAGQVPTDVYYDGFNDACFLYDQAVALIAFLQLGEREAARRLVEAVQNADGSFPFATNQSVLLAHDGRFLRSGAIAWVCYALLLADRPPFRDWFAVRTSAAARKCLDFMSTWLNPLGLVNGGRGRYVGTVLDADYVLPWWSTEHNIDAWWCFDLAATLYGDRRCRTIADTIRAALETEGWSEKAGIFWQGGICTDGGANVPDGQHALDVMSWGSIVLERWGRPADTQAAIARMCRLYYVADAPTGLSGFTTFIPADGYPLGTVPSPWYEGSFGAAFAIRPHNPALADGLLARLVTAQNADGSYPYALRRDPINDIHTFPSLIAAAWNVIAWSGPGTPYPRVLWT
jgi:hypothetical protein